MRQQIRQNETGYLRFTPVEERALPSTCNLTIFVEGQTELAGETYPIVVDLDDTETTLGVDAEVGSDELVVDSTTDFIIGKSYNLIRTDGRISKVKVVGKNSTTLFLDQPIQVRAEEDSEIKGCHYEAELSPTLTANRYRRLRAEWSYVIDGRTKKVNQEFDIVTDPFEINIDSSHIERLDHTFDEMTNGSDAWKSLIQGALNDLVRWLEKRKLYVDLIRDREIFIDCLSAKVLSMFHSTSNAKGAKDSAANWQKVYESIRVEIAESDIWYDANDDLVLNKGSQGASNSLNGSSNELGLPSGFMGIG
jgi:hypothetical protein